VNRRGEEKQERLRKAAVVKLKYQLLTGGYDDGFKQIFAGVLADLDLAEDEVDRYLERHRKEIENICRKG